MAESELGVASLRIVVDTSAALSALAQFRTRFANEIDDLGTINFRGVERGAAEAGQRAGRAIRDGITNATANLRFDNIREALDFSDALDGTLRDLRQYREALVSLREVTPATAAGFGQLNDVIEAATQAIRNYTAGTDQLQDSARRINLRELNAQLREQRQEAAANARIDRQWADAIRTIETAQRGAATATRLANQAFRDQIGLVGTLAQKGARDIAKTVGGVGKGVAAAAKGAVNLGKFGYELGAEFGVFEAPRTGPIKDAIQQVADRFKFLGEQAQTTRGIILRAIEAAGTSAGLVELARNADLLKAALGGVDGAAQVASKGLGILDKVGGGFFDFLSNRFPNTAFGEFARLASGATDVAAGVGSATSSLTNFATQGLSASLDGLQAFIGALSNVPPEAQAAVLALAGISLGFKEKPIVEGLTRVLEYLDGLSGKALKVRGDLSSVLNDLTQFQDKLAAANDQKLLPAFRDRGLTQLDDSVRQGESYRRITDAIAGNWERGARYLEKSNAELRRLVQQGLLLRPLSGSPVVPGGNLLPPGAPASSLPNSQQYAGPIGPEPSLEFLQNKANQAAAALKAVRDAAEALAARQDAQARAIAEFGASPITGRRPDGTAIGGSPAFKRDGQAALRALQQADAQFLGGLQRAQADRRRRIDDATGSAVIGGAFPLLFGQGLGASVGGGLGGFAGGLQGGQFGFGLSLVGTAVGAQLDAAVAKLGALGSALSNPVEKFSELQQAGVLSSKGLERQIQSLIAVGREAEATALIQKDLAATYGDLSSARELAAESDRLNRSWTQLQTIGARLVAMPIVNFLDSFNTGLKGVGDTLQSIFRDYGGQNVKPGVYGGIVTDALGLGPLKTGLKLGGTALSGLFGSEGLFNRGNTSADTKLEKAAQAEKALRSQIQQLTLDQIKAEASGNTGLNTRLQLKLNELKLEQELARLRLKPNSGPEQQQARENAQVERTRIQEQAKAAARVLASQVKSRAEISNSEKLVTAQLNGYERQSLELEKQLALNERNRQLLALPPELRQNSDQARVIEQQAALRIFEINQRIAKSDEKRWADSIAAANRLRSIQEQTAIEAARPNLTGIGTGVLQSLAALRDARRAEQNAQAQLRVTPGDPQLLNASKEASANVRLAAAKTKADLLDAFKAAQDAVRNISRSFEDAKLSLAELQNTSGQGVNRYLNAQQVRQRQEQLNPILVAKAQRAVGTFEASTGIKVPNLSVTGTLEQRNAQLIDVARVFDNESRAVEDLNLTNLELIKASNSLALATAALDVTNTKVADALVLNAQTTSKLIDKNWEVNVNVQSPPAFIPSPG